MFLWPYEVKNLPLRGQDTKLLTFAPEYGKSINKSTALPLAPPQLFPLQVGPLSQAWLSFCYWAFGS